MPTNHPPRIDSSAAPVRRVPRKGMMVLAVAVALTLLSGCLSHNQQRTLDVMNWDRHVHGLRVLSPHSQAQAKAQAWAERLAREGRIYHSNLSDGITVRWCGLAENVGYGSSAESIQQAYMNSPNHRANILNNRWNGVGVGHAQSGGRVYTVQVFIQTC